jgi:prophage regulatory protein
MSFIRLNMVKNLTGLSRSSIYAFIERGKFPKQIKIGERAVAWLESEVNELINARVSGKTDEEVKALVIELEAGRKKLGANYVH